MGKILLYYPYTNIPDGKWLRNSLLYTDKVASILPYDMGNKRIPEITKLLFDEGLYQPIYASEELDPHSPKFENFENNFLETLESKEFSNIKKEVQTFNTSEYNSIGEYVIYTTKLTHKIEQSLRDKLLLKDTENSNEVALEKNTASIYMSMLADYIARKHKGELVPSTDKKEFQELAFQLGDEKAQTYSIILDKCLPTPSENAKIEDIVKFKKKREKELFKFKTLLSEHEEKIYLANDDYVRNLRMLDFQNEVQKEINEIKKLLGDSKLEFVLNGLSSLLDFKQAGIIETVPFLGIAANLPIAGVVGGALMLIGTLVSSFKKLKREGESKALSYIYYAQKDGILGNSYQ